MGRLNPTIDPGTLRRLFAGAENILPPRAVPLAEADGLVIAAPLVAPFGLPRFSNSAMDGFAIRSADARDGQVRLKIVGRSLAGMPFRGVLGTGEAVAIATGAPLPAGADSVVPIEEVEVAGATVLVRRAPAPGRHIRWAGEDVTGGQEVVGRGVALGPGQLAAAAALGVAQLIAYPRAKVAIVPTGDEIAPPGGDLGPAQSYDAVSVALAALLGEAGALPVPRGPAADDPDILTGALVAAAEQADAVISIGGVSVGERDLISRLGGPVRARAFRVRLRPARPFAFGTVCGRPLFCLPGNPGSALAAFEELVRPAILGMMGKAQALRPAVRATLSEDLTQSAGDLHLVRVTVWRKADRLLARPAGRPGAGMMHSLALANAWAVVPSGVGDLPAGSEVDVRMLGAAWDRDPAGD
jgi:molybdopterin molybdotransferase